MQERGWKNGNLPHCQCERTPATPSKMDSLQMPAKKLPREAKPRTWHSHTWAWIPRNPSFEKRRARQHAPHSVHRSQDRQHNPTHTLKRQQDVLHVQDGLFLSHRKPPLKDIMFPGGHRDGMEGSYPKGTQPDSGDHPRDVPSGQKKNQKHRIEFTPKERPWEF